MQLLIEFDDDLYVTLRDHLPIPVEQIIQVFLSGMVKGIAFKATRTDDLVESAEIIEGTPLGQFLRDLGLFDTNV